MAEKLKHTADHKADLADKLATLESRLHKLDGTFADEKAVRCLQTCNCLA